MSSSTCQAYNPQICTIVSPPVPGTPSTPPTNTPPPGNNTPAPPPQGTPPAPPTPSIPGPPPITGSTTHGGAPATPHSVGTAVMATRPLPGSTAGHTLPFTGLDTIALLAIALALLTVGLIVKRLASV